MSRYKTVLSLAAFAMLCSVGCVQRTTQSVSPDGKVIKEEHVLAPAIPSNRADQPAPVDPPGPDPNPGADIHIEGPRRTIDIQTGEGGAKVDVDPKTPDAAP